MPEGTRECAHPATASIEVRALFLNLRTPAVRPRVRQRAMRSRLSSDALDAAMQLLRIVDLICRTDGYSIAGTKP